MEESEFEKQQYLSLRREIEQTKGRIFKIISVGLIAIPSFQFLSYSLKVEVLTLLIPILIIIVSLLYLSENHALMRAGRFIKLEIEKKYEVSGWENWIEQNPYENRTVDKYVSYILYLLFFFYYTTSVSLATIYAKKEFSIIYQGVTIAFFVAIGIWFLFFLIQNIRNTTTTKHDLSNQHGRHNKLEKQS